MNEILYSRLINGVFKYFNKIYVWHEIKIYKMIKLDQKMINEANVRNLSEYSCQLLSKYTEENVQ